MTTKFETIGGVVTRGETFAKIIDLVDQLHDQVLVMAHLHQTEGNRADALAATGWLGMGELFQRMRVQIIKLATSKLQ